MPEVVNRKACDRCHEQKLGCKRLPDGRCERCVKMKMECKSSPSLRDAKKQHQQQQPLKNGSQFRKPDQQQHEERATPDRVNFTERQASVSQHPYTQIQSRQHPNVFEPLQQGAERRLPKRRRTGSDNHLVRRDANLGTLGHLSTGSQPITALGDGVVSMENIVYQDLSQPSMPPGPLLPAQLPSAIGDYFLVHQEFPDHWDNRQLHDEPSQLHHNYPAKLYYENNQQVLPQAAVRPSIVPDPVVSPQQFAFSSSTDHRQHYYRNTPALSSNRRAVVSERSHIAPLVPGRRRSRSRHIKFDLQINNSSKVSQDNQTDLIIMDQVLEVYNRVGVLSASLKRVIRGEAPNADSQENPDIFTVAELYRHTNTLVDILERLATARNGLNRGNGAQFASELSESNRMLMLSLYVLLLEMFDELFCLVRSHLARADPKRDELFFPSGLLPKMNIGDAALGVHPAFHMSMTVELAMQYLNRLRDAKKSLGLTKLGNGNGTRSDGSSASDGLASSSYTNGVDAKPSKIRSQEDALSHSLQHLMGELDNYMDAMDGIDAGAAGAQAK